MAPSTLAPVPQGLPQLPVPIPRATNIPRCLGFLGYLFCRNKQTHIVFPSFSTNDGTCQPARVYYASVARVSFSTLPPPTQLLFEVLLSLHLPTIKVLNP